MTVLPAEKTLLIMTPVGVPLYAARGLSQSLTPVQDAKPAPLRTINGEARFLGGSQMRKYDSVITCTDVDAPPFSGLWPGDVIVVQCVAELSFHTDTGSPERTVVREWTRGAFTIYNPEIDFMVVDFSETKDEYGGVTQWQLTLTEK